MKTDRIDETGNTHGRLTVLGYAGFKGHAMWRCRCVCGNIIEADGTLLRSGHTKSCGCFKRDKVKLSAGHQGFHNALRSMKSNAQKRGILWDLSDAETKVLMQDKCHYCGGGLSNVSMRPDGDQNGAFYYNGIDRVDSDYGYSLDNVVSCCSICNRAKSNLPLQDFKTWIRRLIEYQEKE